jgi:hypothetical protein
MRRRVWVAAVLAAAVTAGLAACHGDARPASDDTALLLDTADWGDRALPPSPVSVETVSHQDLLTKATVVTRRWTTPNGSDRGYELRQDVQGRTKEDSAHDAFRQADPGPDYRAHLGGADPISTAPAGHADEAVGYCVPNPTGCFIISYTLRYGTYLVELSLTSKGATPSSAQPLLAVLDEVMSRRVR